MNSLLKYIFSFLIFLAAIPLQAQTLTEKDTVLSTGIRVGVDVAKIANYFLTNKTNRAYEGVVDVGYKKLLFVAEGGYARLDITRPEPEFSYQSSGLYGRLGVEKNMLKGGDDAIFYGARYAYSNFSYQADKIVITDPYWGSFVTNIPANHASAHWVEGVGGVKVKAIQNIYLGFTIRFKIKFIENGYKEIKPLQIPGFGNAEKRSAFGLSYYIFYRFPFKNNN